MPRKKTKDPNSFKFSMDLTGDNKIILENLSQNYSLKTGPMIHRIIHTFCGISGSAKEAMEKNLLSEYNHLSEEIKNTEDEFHLQRLTEERQRYADMLQMINNGYFKFPKYEEFGDMKKIELKDGYLRIPKEWIVVNPEDASSCSYAAVLECRNSAKYGVPHFVYLNNYKYAGEYTKEMEADFYAGCVKKWSKFKEIEELNRNKDIDLSAPLIGLFSITVQNEDEVNNSSDLPYGATIITSQK